MRATERILRRGRTEPRLVTVGGAKLSIAPEPSPVLGVRTQDLAALTAALGTIAESASHARVLRATAEDTSRLASVRVANARGTSELAGVLGATEARR